MSDFDAQDVLRKVDEGLTPTRWTIIRARKSYFYTQGSAYTLLALFFALVCAMACFLTLGSITNEQAVISDPLTQNNGWLMISLPLFSLLLTVATVWGAVYQFSQLRTVGTHVFLLTPNGCVARTGPKPYQTYGVAYAQVAAIFMSVQRARYESNISLILTFAPEADGTQNRVQWRINPQFRASDAIAQAIIEAHTRYTVTHAPATGG